VAAGWIDVHPAAADSSETIMVMNGEITLIVIGQVTTYDGLSSGLLW
jgi:hypothetical protein